MFSPRSNEIFSNDLFNLDQLRNAENTHITDYNCGGYALGTYSWYLPSRMDIMWGWWHTYDRPTLEKMTQQAVKVMLEDFSDLRVIIDLRQVQKDEYAIAFRLSSDGDFHYIRQDKGKWWTHKRGSTQIVRIAQKTVLSRNWCGRYDGPLVLLAKKRG